MPKTSTSLFPEKKTETLPVNAPEWLIKNLLDFSKSVETKAAKSGKKMIIHMN